MKSITLVKITLWSLAIALVAGYAIVRLTAGPAGQADQTQVEPDLPEIFDMPAWSLTDHHGEAFASDDLAGKPYVAFLFLTNCPTGACPMMVGKMGAMQEVLADTPVEFVSISIDPERDTPEVRRQYVERVVGEGPSEKWHLVTGETPEQMVELATSMKMVAVPESGEHTTQFVLVDAGGTVRGIYGNSDESAMPRLKRDALTLVDEMAK